MCVCCCFTLARGMHFPLYSSHAFSLPLSLSVRMSLTDFIIFCSSTLHQNDGCFPVPERDTLGPRLPVLVILSLSWEAVIPVR